MKRPLFSLGLNKIISLPQKRQEEDKDEPYVCVCVCVSDSNLWLCLQRLWAKHWGNQLMVEGGNEAARPKLRGGGSY